MRRFAKKGSLVEAAQVTDPGAFTKGLGGDTASVGDWLITDSKGRQHVCTAAVFEATYEPVEEPDAADVPEDGALKQPIDYCQAHHCELVSRPPEHTSTFCISCLLEDLNRHVLARQEAQDARDACQSKCHELTREIAELRDSEEAASREAQRFRARIQGFDAENKRLIRERDEVMANLGSHGTRIRLFVKGQRQLTRELSKARQDANENLAAMSDALGALTNAEAEVERLNEAVAEWKGQADSEVTIGARYQKIVMDLCKVADSLTGGKLYEGTGCAVDAVVSVLQAQGEEKLALEQERLALQDRLSRLADEHLQKQRTESALDVATEALRLIHDNGMTHDMAEARALAIVALRRIPEIESGDD